MSTKKMYFLKKQSVAQVTSSKVYKQDLFFTKRKSKAMVLNKFTVKYRDFSVKMFPTSKPLHATILGLVVLFRVGHVSILQP